MLSVQASELTHLFITEQNCLMGDISSWPIPDEHSLPSEKGNKAPSSEADVQQVRACALQQITTAIQLPHDQLGRLPVVKVPLLVAIKVKGLKALHAC